MNDYPMTERAVFFIDKELAAHINHMYLRKLGQEPVDVKLIVADGKFNAMAREGLLPSELYDMSLVVDALQDADIDTLVYADTFSGNVTSAFPTKTKAPIEESLSDEYIVYLKTYRDIPAESESYSDKDALLAEFRETIESLKIVLPADFDWWAHIVSVNGTYFC